VWNPSEWAVQQGSYGNPVTPPTSGPRDGPTVCIEVNAEWIPYMCGSLLQLAQPSTWDVATRDDLLDILFRVTDLIDLVGTAMPCPSPAPLSEAGLRFLTIAAGTGSISGAVDFTAPFTGAPIVLASCDNPALLITVEDATPTGCTLTIAAAVDVDSDTTAGCSWFAVAPGVA
jgi:hypothetical protein